MTTPFPFVAAQVLTANELNSITNLPSSTKTVSYTLVAGDAGKRIVMNSASSTTITVNTSLFTAGDIVELSNIAAGVCTVTAGTATVSSAGPLAIPQYGGGRLVFTSASAAIYFPSAVTVAAPAAAGLTFITSGSVSVQNNLTIANCFSATYDNYLVILNFTANTATTSSRMNYGTSSTKDSDATYNYNAQTNSFYISTGSANAALGGLATTFQQISNKIHNNGYIRIEIFSPNLARPTGYASFSDSLNGNPEIESTFAGGIKDTNTQYTDLFFATSTGNFTFSYRIYGYSNS